MQAQCKRLHLFQHIPSEPVEVSIVLLPVVMAMCDCQSHPLPRNAPAQRHKDNQPIEFAHLSLCYDLLSAETTLSSFCTFTTMYKLLLCSILSLNPLISSLYSLYCLSYASFFLLPLVSSCSIFCMSPLTLALKPSVCSLLTCWSCHVNLWCGMHA